MGYICKLHLWGPMMSSNMADFLLFFTFFSLTLVFLDKIKSFTHNYSFEKLNMYNINKCNVILRYNCFRPRNRALKLTTFQGIEFTAPHFPFNIL